MQSQVPPAEPPAAKRRRTDDEGSPSAEEVATAAAADGSAAIADADAAAAAVPTAAESEATVTATTAKAPAADDDDGAGEGAGAADGPAAASADGAKDESERADAPKRVRRKMAVLLISYSGTGYNGMQIQPTGNTIENALLDALRSTDLITDEHHERVQSMSFQRCARTDKGVHAARQIVSLKMAVDTPDIPARLNAVLPPQIRVQAFMRAPRSFNAKNQCTGRRYQYLAPSYAFSPKGELTEESLAYRVGEAELGRINDVLARFAGTHNYHNFTSRKTHDDPSSRRYITSFVCDGPIVIGGVEFVRMTVCGQSFLLHMIRKMVGLTMAIVRGYTDIDVMDRAFGPFKVDVPRAPGLGLLLDACFFDVYNKKYEGDPAHPPMGWPELDPAIEAFKRDVIFAEMVKTEAEERVIFNWLQTLPNHDYSASELPPPKKEQQQGGESAGGGGAGEAAAVADGGCGGGPGSLWKPRKSACYSAACKAGAWKRCYSIACRQLPGPDEGEGNGAGAGAAQGGGGRNKRKKGWNPRSAGTKRWRKRPKR